MAKYGHASYGELKLGLPFEKTEAKFSFCDLLSIPDLAAGSIQAILVEEGKGIDAKIRDHANGVLLWLTYDSVFLKKMTIHVRPTEEGRIEVASTKFIPIEAQRANVITVSQNGKKAARILKKMRSKIALSHKYERLARIAGSKGKQKAYSAKARKYDHQATQLLWFGEGMKR